MAATLWDILQYLQGPETPVEDGTADASRRSLPPNPAFSVVRGGPFGADAGRSGMPAHDLANFLRGQGISEALASQYEKNAVSFGASPGNFSATEAYFPLQKLILLSGWLNRGRGQRVEDLNMAAQHEAAHAYDATNGITSSDSWISRVNRAIAERQPNPNRFANYMDNLNTILEAKDMPHTFTAALDEGLNSSTIPPVLASYYKDLWPAKEAKVAFHFALPQRRK